jgi:hypothetical protein
MSNPIELWQKLGTAPGTGARLARLITYALLLFLAWNSVTTIFDWPEQGILGILTIALAFAVHKTSQK